MTNKTWRVGVAGLGTVGGGLLQFLAERPGFAPAGDKAVVTAVSARNKSRPRTVDISGLAWFDDPVALAASPDVDLFVELIGGSDGPAKVAVETALKAGKPVVTANKALIAVHGAELAALAEAQGVPLVFEAAVMGGTPAVKMLREALVGDDVISVAGILNGTCNYILTEMEKTGRAFADVLREAQGLGYAEADPTTDVGGFDAGHKISILAALAFGCAPNFEAAEIEGISDVELLDIKLAKDLGYRIKLIASAAKSEDGVAVKVHPSLVPLDHPLAQAGGALNALFIEGVRIGRIFVQGAGGGPGGGGGPAVLRRGGGRGGQGRRGARGGRGADGRRGGRRHRRRHDPGRASGVPGAGRRPGAVHRHRSSPRRGQGLSARHGPGPTGRDRCDLGNPGRMRRLDRQLPAEARRGSGRRADRARYPCDAGIQAAGCD